jgi:hypothetical protein
MNTNQQTVCIKVVNRISKMTLSLIIFIAIGKPALSFTETPNPGNQDPSDVLEQYEQSEPSQAIGAISSAIKLNPESWLQELRRLNRPIQDFNNGKAQYWQALTNKLDGKDWEATLNNAIKNFKNAGTENAKKCFNEATNVKNYLNRPKTQNSSRIKKPSLTRGCQAPADSKSYRTSI